jgi:hypothetical protein
MAFAPSATHSVKFRAAQASMRRTPHMASEQLAAILILEPP